MKNDNLNAYGYIQSYVVTGSVENVVSVPGTYSNSYNYYVGVYVDDGTSPGQTDGTLYTIPTHVIIITPSNYFIALPSLSSITTDGLTFSFTPYTTLGTITSFINIQPSDALGVWDGRLSSLSIGNPTCKISTPTTSTSIILSGCSLAPNAIYWLRIYIEGIHSPTSFSPADGLFATPIKFTTPPAQSTPSTLTLSYIDYVSIGIYNYQVRSSNAITSGPPTPSTSISTATVPSPSQPLVVSSTPTSSIIRWEYSDDGGSQITSFSLYISTSYSNLTQSPFILTFSGLSTSAVLSDLTSGSTYLIKLQAINIIGPSKNSSIVTIISCSPPSQPQNLTYTPITINNLLFMWSPPNNDGGCLSISYIVMMDGVIVVPFISNIPYLSTSYDATGLISGSLHTIAIRAINSAGASAWTITYNVYSALQPSPPTSFSISSSSTTSLSISWLEGSGGGGLSYSGYRLFLNGSPLSILITPSSTTSTTISSSTLGLLGGSSLCLSLSADTPSTLPTVTPTLLLPPSLSSTVCGWLATVPNAPSTVTLSHLILNSIEISWAVSSTGGSPILYYEINVSPSMLNEWVIIATVPSSQLSIVYTGCITGSIYDFQIRTNNIVGNSPYSYVVTGYCAISPSQPLAPQWTGSTTESISISWSPPSLTGGAPIISYNLYARIGSVSSIIYTGSSTSFTHTGLKTGQSIYYSIAAISNAGPSISSIESSFIVSALPTTPILFSISSSTSTSFTFNWLHPSSNGGSTITSYQLLYGTSSNLINNIVWTGFSTTSAPINLITNTLYYFQLSVCNIVSSYTSPPTCTLSYILSGTPSAIVAPCLSCTAVPDAPNFPTFLSFSTPFISVSLSTLGSVGGGAITEWVVNAGPSYSQLGSLLSSTSTSISIDCSNVLNIAGSSFNLIGTYIYINAKAINSFGTSLPSPPALLWCASPPTPPTPKPISSINVVGINWSILFSSVNSYTYGAPIISYNIYFADATISLTPSLISTITDSSKSSFSVTTGIVEGREYLFQLSLTTAVTASSLSSIIHVYACSSISTPTPPYNIPGGSSTYALIGWNAPTINGCQITGYRVFAAYPMVSSIIFTSVYPTTYTSLTDPLDYSLSPTPLQASVLCNGPTISYFIRVYTLKEHVDTGVITLNCGGSPSQILPPIQFGDPSGSLDSIGLTWSIPSSLNGGIITGYRVYRNNGPSTSISSTPDITCGRDMTSGPLNCLITSLINSVTYTIEMSAVNTIGEGPKSIANLYTAANVPASPDQPIITDASDLNGGSLTLSWNPPTSNGLEITFYSFMIYLANGGGQVGQFNGPTGSSPAVTDIIINTANFPGINVGTQYQLCVQADNNLGSSVCSLLTTTTTISVTNLNGYVLSSPTFSPTITRDPSVIPSSGSVSIVWTEPSDTGGDDPNNIIYYLYGGVVTSPIPTATSLLSALQGKSTTSYTQTIPTGYQWQFMLSITNSRGDISSPSIAFNFISCDTPSNPNDFNVVTGGTTTTTLTWTDPSVLGGTFLTGYYACCQATSCVTLSPSIYTYSFLFLPNGETTFTIQAINDAGTGSTSSYSCDPGISCSSGCC